MYLKQTFIIFPLFLKLYFNAMICTKILIAFNVPFEVFIAWIILVTGLFRFICKITCIRLSKHPSMCHKKHDIKQKLNHFLFHRLINSWNYVVILSKSCASIFIFIKAEANLWNKIPLCICTPIFSVLNKWIQRVILNLSHLIPNISWTKISKQLL